MTVQRYTWEDAVVDAQAAGLISNGALMVCLKLARAINWSPQDGRKAGLYWANDEAFKTVGLSRTAYYDHRKELFDVGFFTQEKGNLIPEVPDLSAVRTDESVVRTTESVVRIEESVVRNPFSEDTYSDDVLSEDSLNEEAPPTSASLNYEYLGSIREEDYPSLTLEHERLDYFSNGEVVTAVANSVEDTPESVVRTEEDNQCQTDTGWEKEEEGEKYLERLLELNHITGTNRSKARQLYWDTDHEPTITNGIYRAGWILNHLTNKRRVAS